MLNINVQHVLEKNILEIFIEKCWNINYECIFTLVHILCIRNSMLLFVIG